jgi:hypothetical protein
MRRFGYLALPILFILLATGTAMAQSLALGSCEDELDRLKKRATDASEAAETAKSKLDDLDECRRYPETYDLLHDGCRSRRSDYESAMDDLQSNLDDIDSSLRSVQDSCGYNFSLKTMSSADAAQRSLCRSYKRLMSLGVSPSDVLKQCKPQMGDNGCKACLDSK